MSAKRAVDPELVAEQIALSFRILDDMELFLAERKLPDSDSPPPDRA